ncbi:MAG TPA: hypothetical protein DCX53_13715 [Anaerolineae bacterium]|nr:hypothetical protein [Anaerolineae bacterium]
MTNITRKFFLWSIALVLILACVPSVSTPVPPLDPNVINTFIVQTADAASAKTQAAIPPTLTATATLRSTFTPESTFTVVPIITFPTSTLVQRLQYFRVKHDTQLAEFNYQSRTAADDWPVDDSGWQTPEVVPLLPVQRLKSGTHRTILDRSWEIFIDALNDQDKRKIRYLKADNTALFDGKGFPYLESKTMGGNIVSIDELQGGWGRVHTLDLKSPGSLKDMTYATRPDVIHKMVVIKYNKNTRITSWVHAPPGPIYWPLVSDVPLWIPLDRLEPFPGLPMSVTALITQEIKTKPSTDGTSSGFELAEGASATIREYYPSGSNVWARLSGGGWIALFRYEKGAPTYFTTWKMETLPPPP